MEDGLARSETVYISSKAHLNLSFNLCQCGLTSIWRGGGLDMGSEDLFALCYVNRGSVSLRYDRIGFRIAAGQGFFILPDTICSVQNMEQEIVEVVWTTFTG